MEIAIEKYGVEIGILKLIEIIWYQFEKIPKRYFEKWFLLNPNNLAILDISSGQYSHTKTYKKKLKHRLNRKFCIMFVEKSEVYICTYASRRY